MINRSKIKVMTLVSHDKGLLAIFTGMILTVIALLSLAVTAGVWYL